MISSTTNPATQDLKNFCDLALSIRKQRSSPDYLQKLQAEIRAGINKISAPENIYYRDKTVNDYRISFVAAKDLTDKEAERIIELSSQLHAHSFKIDLQNIKKNSCNYLLVKNKEGNLIAYNSSLYIDKNLPQHFDKLLSQVAARRPLKARGFIALGTAIQDEYKRRGLFRLIVNSVKTAYQADYRVSTIFPVNHSSLTANHALGSEDIGNSDEKQRILFLDFKKYLPKGTKPINILYPFDDPSGEYSNVSDNRSHSFDNGTAYAYDFLIPIGTAIKSVAGGKVIEVIDSNPDKNSEEVSLDDFSKTNRIVIEGSNHLRQFYGHIKKNSAKVKVGDQVKTGHLICESGHNGISTEPHLHFSLHKNNNDKQLVGGDSVPVRFVNQVTKKESNSIFVNIWNWFKSFWS